jgi:plasmid maintenance system antidote protein VapI
MSNEYEPDVVSPPGDALLDILEEREMKVQDLSKLTSMSEQMIHRILSGLEPVTPAIASELEDALGIPAPFWNRREFMYQQWLKSKGIEL